MTTLIPDSWEMPSYVAGDLVPMNRYRDRERSVISDPGWAEGEGADVVVHPKWRIDKTQPESTWEGYGHQLGEIEPYDPEIHGRGPAELYSQDQLNALHGAGFEPHDDGVWHRSVHNDAGDHLGVTHMLSYDPGNRLDSGQRASWHLTTNPEEVGTVHPSLREALRSADADQAAVRKMSAKQARRHLAMLRTAAQTPAQIAAQKWLEENSDDFETWHPERERATPGENYSDFMDPAGQTFGHDDEGTSHVMPGSHYDWNNPESTLNDSGDDEDSGDPPAHEQSLADHGFNWEHRGDPNTTPVGEYQEGQYVRHQHDPEGNHIATHTIHRDPNRGTWNLESGPSDTQDFLTSYTEHQFPHDAIDKWRQNSAEALLPGRGYEPHRGRTGWATHWTRTDPAPEGSGMQPYEHEIFFPESEGGFTGQTLNNSMQHGNWATNGSQSHHSHDLADVVREQDDLGRGRHPGGVQDHRLSSDELLNDPSVSRLGRPTTMSSNFYGDGRVGRANWHMPHPETPHGVNAEAVYNWDKGGYDFKYTSDGVRLAPTHNYVPEGAPVHVPGRAPQLSLEH